MLYILGYFIFAFLWVGVFWQISDRKNGDDAFAAFLCGMLWPFALAFGLGVALAGGGRK